jgi:hypothetical protein
MGHSLILRIFMGPKGVDFIKQFTPYACNLRSAPILFEQIYSNLTSCIYALRSTFCIVCQIFGALYALRPAPNFYEIHPGINKLVCSIAQKMICLIT